MKSKCPHCGKIEELPPEYFKQRWLCEGCGREYIVGVVYVTKNMFSNNVAKILCPYCEQRNVLPWVAVNKNVACGSCDETFHVRITQHTPQTTNVPSADVPSTGHVVKKIRAIISVIVAIILLIWLSPHLLGILREVTGTDFGLEKLMYDDADCGLEIAAALLERNYAEAMRWANRIKDDRLRRINIINIKKSERLYNTGWLTD